MKKTSYIPLISAAFALAPLVAPADTFFADYFTNSSTLNAAPTIPKTNSTSYEVISSKSWSPTPSIASRDLKFGIGASTGGTIELEALFSTNSVALTEPGDVIQMTIVFTNTSGLLTQAGALGVGLYSSGQSFPVSGGLNGTAVNSQSGNATGGAQNWQGYFAQIAQAGYQNGHRIINRPAQTSGPDNRNQDLVTTGSGSQSFATPGGTVIVTNASTLTLTAGSVYTETLSLFLIGSNNIAITNTLYSGPDTTGSVLTQSSGITSNNSYLVSGFDSFAIGWRSTANASPTTIDISSIVITGAVTVVTNPPDITLQPSPVSVPAGQAGAFTVAARGFDLTYQWHRNGTNLLNGGNISGANSPSLIISPASAADVASGLNGYYVTVGGAGGYTTNSITNSLSLRTAANLVWSGTSDQWDLNTTADWLIGGSTPSVFNFGDNVTFDDTPGAGITSLTLAGNFLSAASVTVNSGLDYTFSGAGNFAGPGHLIYIGSGHLRINNANSYSGGTLVSNTSAYLVLNNYGGLGVGPVTLAAGQMEIIPAGAANNGINGDIIVADDFLINYDANSSFGAVFLGNLSGTPTKNLTINFNNTSASATNQTRVRVYGTNTVCGINIILPDTRTVFASYQGIGLQTYNGVISGSGGFMQKGTTTIFNGLNTYTGPTVPAQGVIALGVDSVGTPPSISSGPIGTGPLSLTVDSTSATTGTGQILAFGGPRTLGNAIQYPTGGNNLTLGIGGTNDLILSGDFALNGQDGLTTFSNRIVQVTNTGLTTMTGTIGDGGVFPFGLTKTGAGTLALGNTETYSGPTIISGGRLLVNGQIGNGAVTVTNGGILGGNGIVTGPVTIGTNGTLAPGASIGTITLNNNLTFAVGGTNLVEVTKTPSAANDRTVVSGTATLAGSLTVSILGATLPVGGDTFTILTATSVSGTFANLDGSGRVAVPNNGGSFHVTISSTSVVLDNYLPPTPAPVASYTAAPTTGVRPSKVTFTDTSTGSSTNLFWDFGDTVTLNTNNFGGSVIHTYAAEGSYNVKLVASGIGGSSTNSAITITVTVPNPPHITNTVISAGNLVLSGNNGPTGGGYSLLVYTSTNVNAALNTWTLAGTFPFNADGTFSASIPVTVSNPRQFYIIKMP